MGHLQQYKRVFCFLLVPGLAVQQVSIAGLPPVATKSFDLAGGQAPVVAG